LSLSEHELGTVQTDGLYLETNLAVAWLCERQVLDLKHVGVSRFMKANDLWHSGSPVLFK